ncbi:hypothetical protein PAV_141p01990 (plasmid) [Paenibacillus alvei DSM 29]|nr:hypothetical protein PAV_141p01990 [Paenibacillus alvei DSM 29]
MQTLFDKYKEAPVAYAEDVLGLKLYDYQKEILRMFSFGKRVAYFQGGRCSGKFLLQNVINSYQKNIQGSNYNDNNLHNNG